MRRKRITKRVLSVFLALSMVFGGNTITSVPVSAQENGVSALAEEAKTPGWGMTSGSVGLVEISKTQVKTGTQSLHIKDELADKYLEVVSDPIQVVSGSALVVSGSAIAVSGSAISVGQTYELTADVYAVSQTNSLEVTVKYYDSSQKLLGTDMNSAGISNLFKFTEKNVWKTINFDFKPVTGTTEMRIVIKCGGGTNQNMIDAYLDNVTILDFDTKDVIEGVVPNGGFEEEVVTKPVDPKPPVDPEEPKEPEVPVVIEPANAIKNPSFEEEVGADGRIPGWNRAEGAVGTTEVSTVQKFDGDKSLYFVDSSTSTWLKLVSDPVKVEAGKEYILKGQAYMLSNKGRLNFYLNYFNSNDEVISNSGNSLFGIGQGVIKEQWSPMEITLKIPENTVYVTIVLEIMGSGGANLVDTYLDDISLTCSTVDVPPVELAEEIQNPGFEEALVDGKIPNWQFAEATDGIMNLSSDIVHTGKNSLYFNDNDNKKMLRVISDKFKVEPSTSYLSQAFTYVKSQSHNVVFEIYYYDANDKQVSVKTEMFSSVSLGTEKWTAIKVASTSPANAVSARIAFYSGEISYTEAYFDEVILTKVVAGELLDREYGEPVDLGEMVKVNLGQAAAISKNALGEWEIYFVSNGLTGTFYALDAFTGEIKFKEVLPNTGAAVWAITIGADKNVYVGSTEDGKMHRYIPTEKKVENLGAVTPSTWIWDLEATTDGKIYGGTFADKKGGRVFEYDIETKSIRDYGIIESDKDYVRGIAVDDTYIYAAMGTPKKLMKIHRESGEATEIYVEGYTGFDGMMDNVFVINNKLCVSVQTNKMVIMDKDTLEIESTFMYTNMLSTPHPDFPNLIYYRYLTQFFQYDFNTNKSTEIIFSSPLSSDVTRVKDMVFINEDPDDEPLLAMIIQNGEYLLIDPVNAEIKLNMMLNVGGSAVNIQALESWNKDGKLYLGGYQRGMTIYNPYTNTIEKSLPSFAQPEGIGFLNDYVYYGTYVGSIMYRYHPEIHKDKNPELVYDIGNHQDRPFALTSGDNKLFVGNVADYGVLGGTLAIYDEPTNTWTQYDNVVKDQAIIGLAYKDGLLYGSTTVWGGLGIEPSEKEAKIFVWDVEQGKKIDEFTPSIPFIDEAPRMIGELSFGPDGYLWGIVEGTLFAIDVSTREVVKSLVVSPSLYNSSKWKPFRIEWAPDGIMYTSIGRKLVAVDTDTMRYKVINTTMINDMTVGIDGTIYFAPNAGTKLYKIEVPQTNATLRNVTVGGKAIANFSPGTLEYTVTRPSDMTVVAIPVIEKATTEVINNENKMQIKVLAEDKKSTLTYTFNWTDVIAPVDPPVNPPVNPPVVDEPEVTPPVIETPVDMKKYLEQVEIKDKILLYVGGTKDNRSNLSLTYPSNLVVVDKFSATTSKDRVEMMINTIVSERVKGNKVDSSSGEVISLDKQGNITANGEGTATITTVITLKDGSNKSLTTTVKVEKASISFTKSASTMHLKEETNLEVEVKGYDISTLQWGTEKASIVTVGKNTGKLEASVTAKSVGEDTLYVRVKDKNGKWVREELAIVVEKPSITFTKSSSKMKVGDKVTFEIEVKGYDISTLEWRTKEALVVTVGRNTGELQARVTAKSKGNDTLYVRVKNNNGEWVTKTISITVTKAK